MASMQWGMVSKRTFERYFTAKLIKQSSRLYHRWKRSEGKHVQYEPAPPASQCGPDTMASLMFILQKLFAKMVEIVVYHQKY